MNRLIRLIIWLGWWRVDTATLQWGIKTLAMSTDWLTDWLSFSIRLLDQVWLRCGQLISTNHDLGQLWSPLPLSIQFMSMTFLIFRGTQRVPGFVPSDISLYINDSFCSRCAIVGYFSFIPLNDSNRHLCTTACCSTHSLVFRVSHDTIPSSPVVRPTMLTPSSWRQWWVPAIHPRHTSATGWSRPPASPRTCTSAPRKISAHQQRRISPACSLCKNQGPDLQNILRLIMKSS